MCGGNELNKSETQVHNEVTLHLELLCLAHGPASDNIQSRVLSLRPICDCQSFCPGLFGSKASCARLRLYTVHTPAGLEVSNSLDKSDLPELVDEGMADVKMPIALSRAPEDITGSFLAVHQSAPPASLRPLLTSSQMAPALSPTASPLSPLSPPNGAFTASFCFRHSTVRSIFCSEPSPPGLQNRFFDRPEARAESKAASMEAYNVCPGCTLEEASPFIAHVYTLISLDLSGFKDVFYSSLLRIHARIRSAVGDENAPNTCGAQLRPACVWSCQRVIFYADLQLFDPSMLNRTALGSRNAHDPDDPLREELFVYEPCASLAQTRSVAPLQDNSRTRTDSTSSASRDELSIRIYRWIVTKEFTVWYRLSAHRCKDGFRFSLLVSRLHTPSHPHEVSAVFRRPCAARLRACNPTPHRTTWSIIHRGAPDDVCPTRRYWRHRQRDPGDRGDNGADFNDQRDTSRDMLAAHAVSVAIPAAAGLVDGLPHKHDNMHLVGVFIVWLVAAASIRFVMWFTIGTCQTMLEIWSEWLKVWFSPGVHEARMPEKCSMATQPIGQQERSTQTEGL
ncbi:hypothetical protein K488DRAFT_75100 [Vararia minispora EC-137]|uniref:Uncharacterized protein n=1 Tax=Vararia minispora EC-137 TaxID=1314806 RepID=A0ACB8Q513_9AGAM|nr:hypothetical protein K488DRAFT_75100 [Vararia minispora EC-137]